uniref:C2 domain-containing protein n=1 Tax=Schistosoma mansoni TaxID=6183 RepID=A0A5K4EPL0_SCHMA
MDEPVKNNQHTSHSDPEEVRILESSLQTKHKHKSRQFPDFIDSEKTKLDVTQSNNDDSTVSKPPVAKKRKKISKKPVTIRSSDMATESIKSEIHLSKKDKVVQRENQPISTSPSMKYEQSKQLVKSKSSYPLPERMQRLRRSTGLGELSTSPDLSLSDLKGNENFNQINNDEFFTKEWYDNSKQNDTTYNMDSISKSKHLTMNEPQSKLLKGKRFKTYSSKRIESNMEDNSMEVIIRLLVLINYYLFCFVLYCT